MGGFRVNIIIKKFPAAMANLVIAAVLIQLFQTIRIYCGDGQQ